MISNEMLKKKIYNYAIWGKLSKNNDKESSSKFLDQIFIEQKKYDYKSIKTTKTEEIPFEIPKNWTWCTLGELFEINLGFTHTPKYTEEGIKFLSVKDISNGKIDFSNTKYVSEDEYNKAAYGSKPQKGDILFGRVGTIGVPQIIETDEKFCIFVSLGFLRDYTNLINKKYICYWFNSSLFKNQVFKHVSGAAQINLNTNWLKNFLIPVPPKEEQDRIENVTEQLLNLIDKKEKNDQEKEKLKAILKEKILDDAIYGKLIENDLSLPSVDVEEIKEDKPFEIPNNWKWTIFSEIIDVRDGTHDSPKYVNESDYPLITSKNLTPDGIDFNNVNYLKKEDYDEINKRSFVEDGDILFAMIGSIGNPVIVSKDRNFAIKNVALFKCSSKIKNKFLYYYLLSQGKMQNKIKGGVQSFIPLKSLRSYEIPLPPLAQQQKIVNKIEELFNLIDNIK